MRVVLVLTLGLAALAALAGGMRATPPPLDDLQLRLLSCAGCHG